MDVAALLNFLVDLLLLVGTDRLAGYEMRLPRLLGASVLGGIYSGLSLGFPMLGGYMVRAGVLGAMLGIAYGVNPSALRRGAVFLLLSLALGGIAMGVRQARFGLLLLQALSLLLLCRMAFGERLGGREYVPVTLSYEGRQEKLTVLRDTGNSLRDPLSGEPVLVISGDCAGKLTGLSPEQLKKPMETLCAHPIPGLRLIPCSTVEGSGMLLGLRFPGAILGGRKQDALVAFSPGGLGENGYYQGLTGGIL